MKISTLDQAKQQEVSHNAAIKKRTLVQNGEIEHITHFSEAVFPPGEIAYAHSHQDMTEVFFIKSGTGLITVDNQPIALQSGMCITVEPHEVHELKNTGSTNLVVMYFGVTVK
ncbi:MAG: cupin domain-containing protein [Methylococcaceae bacterium]